MAILKTLRYYLLGLFLIIASAAVVVNIPWAANLSQNTLANAGGLPTPRPAVAAAEKINLPPVNGNFPAPEFTARAVLVKDLSTDTVLFQKNINQELPIASTTKIMTALVGSEYFKPNDVLTVNKGAGVEGSSAGLVKGEQLTFRSVLYGMLLPSGNDAAFTIAENYPGGIPGFVAAMNKKAQELNLKNTHFDNPAGFDSPNHFASASDLAKITEVALKDSQLSRVFDTKETEIVSIDKQHTHMLHNLNQLLSTVPGVLGVKTGYTEEAKENLVTLVKRDNHKILTIILGSDDRFGESTALIEWAYKNFTWQ